MWRYHYVSFATFPNSRYTSYRWYVSLEMVFSSHLTSQTSPSMWRWHDWSTFIEQINDSIYVLYYYIKVQEKCEYTKSLFTGQTIPWQKEKEQCDKQRSTNHWRYSKTNTQILRHGKKKQKTDLSQPTISLEMPVPSQGQYGFHSFRLLTDFVCLYNYEFWLSLCKIVRSSVILLLPLYIILDLKWLEMYVGKNNYFLGWNRTIP
jgi:hypothetical protein